MVVFGLASNLVLFAFGNKKEIVKILGRIKSFKEAVGPIHSDPHMNQDDPCGDINPLIKYVTPLIIIFL